MAARKTSPDRVTTFSDGVFAVLWPTGLSQRVQRLMRMRSFITIAGFVAAGLVALRWPVVGMALICLCLIGCLRPDVPTPKNVGS